MIKSVNALIINEKQQVLTVTETRLCLDGTQTYGCGLPTVNLLKNELPLESIIQYLKEELDFDLRIGDDLIPFFGGIFENHIGLTLIYRSYKTNKEKYWCNTNEYPMKNGSIGIWQSWNKLLSDPYKSYNDPLYKFYLQYFSLTETTLNESAKDSSHTSTFMMD